MSLTITNHLHVLDATTSLHKTAPLDMTTPLHTAIPLDVNGAAAPLHIATPLILSTPLSQHCGFKVYLKLENTQPAGSYKIRGIGNLIQKAKKKGYTRVVCSSAGNAGMAAASAARQCGLPATVVLPENTPNVVIEKLKKEKASVIIHGKVWDAANKRAKELAEEPGVAYVPPFDHPDIWEGIESLAFELSSTLSERPDAVIASVGGGGLMSGIVQGLQKVGWGDVPVVTVETHGADSFYQSVDNGALTTLDRVSSVAKSLCVLTVSKRAFDLHYEHPIIPARVTDKEAVSACLQFLDDHRIMVEPACGAALAGVYGNTMNQLRNTGKLGPIKSVVVVVCGGNVVNMKLLESWKTQFNLH